jgi:predicted pPIWI-associating nuclease
VDEISLDDVLGEFNRFERQLKASRRTWSRSEGDADTIRRLFESWHRDYRPRFQLTLGDHPAMLEVDDRLSHLRTRAGRTLDVGKVRKTLREIAHVIDSELLPAYAAARWSDAVKTSGDVESRTSDIGRDPIVERLTALDPRLGARYHQALLDLRDDKRLSYLGAAGEIREALRAATHLLAPDEEAIKQQSWYKGHEGKPTQAERIRFVVQERSEAKSAAEAAELVETMVGALGREVYTRASNAFHSGSERAEVQRVEGYARAVLADILPG